jgi:SAM-dependent methyltransferase
MKDLQFSDNHIHVFPDTLDEEKFAYFEKYDYASWVPPVSRRNWITQNINAGEYLDIGCGAYPVTMDIPGGIARGIGVDISPHAARLYSRYFKEFYLFNIARISPRSVPELAQRFPTIILSETLEHFAEPEKVLETIRAFLAPKGQLLVTYPNIYSIAQRLDRFLHGGAHSRFKTFHKSHVFLIHKKALDAFFSDHGYRIVHFDCRPSDIVEGFPSESNPVWKRVARAYPSLLGHQFFYILERAL